MKESFGGPLGVVAVLLAAVVQVAGEYCDNGIFCAPPKVCCGNQCCLVDTGEDSPYGFHHLTFWNMWYFWFIVIFLIISCFGGCGYWRRRHVYLSSNSSRGRRSRGGSFDEDSQSTDGRETPFPSLQFSPHGCFPAPPPYSEVTSKPDMYPLVQGGAEYKDDAPPYSYTNTPYIHSFIHFTSDPLYPSSPADSNCSSLPFSANQANSVYPPPYSDGACAVSNVSTPGSLLSAYTPTDVSSVHYGPGSPPVATTPSSLRVFSELGTPSEGASPSPDADRLLSTLVANIQSMTSQTEAAFASHVTTPVSPTASSTMESSEFSSHPQGTSEVSSRRHCASDISSHRRASDVSSSHHQSVSDVSGSQNRSTSDISSSQHRSTSDISCQRPCSTDNSSQQQSASDISSAHHRLPALVLDCSDMTHHDAAAGMTPSPAPSGCSGVLQSPPEESRGRSSPSLLPWRRRSSAASDATSPMSDMSSVSHPRLFSLRFAAGEDTANLVECAIETDALNDG